VLAAGSVAFPSYKQLLEWRRSVLAQTPPHGLGWKHLADLEDALFAKRFPVSYPLF
jgi:hypothetical protein